ncbi:unnamed protein product [Arabidopsis thaliana]|uniref:Uncharacterized protein n=1 Tax=Arabidopsis thaliana TaxID=3702 RepID=A0A654GB46_ARATH|nr:unnamed protein product [Arabidopsis thaliana]
MTTKMVSSHRLLTLMVVALLLIPMISGQSSKCTKGCTSTPECNIKCMKKGGGHCQAYIGRSHGRLAIENYCCCNNYSNSPISSPVMN